MNNGEYCLNKQWQRWGWEQAGIREEEVLPVVEQV